MSRDVEVEFGANTGNVIAGIQDVTRQLEQMGSVTQGMISTFAAFGEAFAAAFAIDKFTDIIEKVNMLGLEVQRTSEQLGISAETVSKYNYAAETMDVSTQQMRTSLERLTAGLNEAEKGGNKQAAAFNLMGINARDFIKSGGTVEDLVNRIGTATAQLAPKMNLSAAYMALMGRSGAAMMPVFQEIATHMREVGEAAQRAGVILSQEMVQGIAATRDKMDELTQATKGIGIALYANFKPAIDTVVQGMVNWIESITQAMNQNTALRGAIQMVQGGFLLLYSSITELISKFMDLWDTALAVVRSIAAETVRAYEVMKSAATLHFKDISTIMRVGNEEHAKIWTENGNKIIAREKATTETLKKTWEDYFKNLAAQPGKNVSGDGAGAKGKPGAPLEEGPSYAELAKKAEEEAIAHYETMQKFYQDDYDAWTYFEMKKLQLLKKNHGQESKEYQQELQRKIEFDRRYAEQHGRIYTRVFQDMAHGMQDVVGRVMNGTLKMNQVWKAALLNMVSSFGKGFAMMIDDWIKRMVTQWITAEATKTNATLIGNTARTASDTAAATASSAGTFSKYIKDITAAAAKTYAGVFAFLSPTMGPFAAIPAGVSAALVAGMTALIPSFDVGTSYVQQDGIAMIHRGERIVTARDNASGNFGPAGGGNRGGGGINIHFNGPVYGQRNFEAAVAKAVASAGRNFNPHLARSMK